MPSPFRPSRLFWRVFFPQSVVVLAGTALAGAAVAASVADPAARARLLGVVVCGAAAGTALAAGLSAWLARQLAGAFQALGDAVEQIGDDGAPAVPADAF